MGETRSAPDFAFDGQGISQSRGSQRPSYSDWAPAGAPPPDPTVDLLYSTAGSRLSAQAQAARAAEATGPFVQQPYGPAAAPSPWEIGRVGEQVVAHELIRLRELDPRWGYLHSIPVGQNGADIDHLLIGPGGVFTINTKHHAGGKLWVAGGTFMVNGCRQPYVRNSRHESQRAARLLARALGRPIPVVGVIVPVKARALEVREQPGDVWVIPCEHLAGYFYSCRPALPQETVIAIFDEARKPQTWLTKAAPQTECAPRSQQPGPTQEPMETDSFTFRRWRNFGHDRLYVARKADGHQLGYWNLGTNGSHPTDDEVKGELGLAFYEWKQANGSE
ncbi:nuclease-related domain-containing protein [Tessaracoccus sp. ZS01]|uniref:nuclease-related domain-containing protein n=1 Tax=Tessaracoccus sp. ZS01 TaxID=1906324 RepID=UPI0009F8EEA1|nr:nuclease-related domain-containing protein [Tessaracoccus sp. ZS01]MCG6568706.1 NERD domain-containing protein [Tessaracoccus sp. ZS01]